MVNTSGPAISIVPFRGSPAAVRATTVVLLHDLRAEIAGLRQPVAPDHRQRDVVPQARLLASLDQVPGDGAEERHHVVVGERRRVRHVDHHLGVLQHLLEALAGERVHAGGWRRRHRVVAVLGQLAHDLRADETGPADDDNLHDAPFENVSDDS
jgi:hypothetical protein